MPKFVPPFTGIWPAMITPYDTNMQISRAGIEKLVAMLIKDGAGGLFICGSTGEGVLLSPEERKKVAEITVGAVAGQIPVMVHVGAPATADAMDLARHAKKIGADAVSTVAPIYYVVAPDTGFAYYNEVAKASDLPFYCYVFLGRGIENIPIRDFVSRLLNVPHAAGLKYTSPEMHNIALMKAYTQGKLNVFSGYDECFLAAKMQGADGAVGSFYNIFLPRWENVRKTVEAGHWQQARDAMIAAVDLLYQLLPYGVDGIKHVLRLRGVETGTVRGPLPRIGDEQKKKIEAVMEKAGF